MTRKVGKWTVSRRATAAKANRILKPKRKSSKLGRAERHERQGRRVLGL